MGRQNGENNRLYDVILEMGLKFRPMNLTLGGPITIDRDSPPLLALDPGGAIRTITLPAVEIGLAFVIIHTGGAFDITINNPAAATVATLSTTEIAFVFCNGVAWYGGVIKTT